MIVNYFMHNIIKQNESDDMRKKTFALLLLLAFLIPLAHTSQIEVYDCWVFYDGNAAAGDPIQTALSILIEGCDEALNLKPISVNDMSDLKGSSEKQSMAILLFHGDSEGIQISGPSSENTMISWVEIAEFIDSTNYEEYFVLACDSSNLQEYIQRENVHVIPGDIDAKIAATFALYEMQGALLNSDPLTANRIRREAIRMVKENDDFAKRFFNPIEPLGESSYSGTLDVSPQSFAAETWKSLMNVMRAQTMLITNEMSYNGLVTEGFDTIMSLVVDFMDFYFSVATIGFDFTTWLATAYGWFLDGTISIFDLVLEIQYKADMVDFWLFLIDVVTSPIPMFGDYLGIGVMFAEALAALGVFDVQTMGIEYGPRSLDADCLARAMDDYTYNSVALFPAPDITSVYDAIEDLVWVLENTAVDPDTISDSVDAIVDSVDDALYYANRIDGHIESTTVGMLNNIKNAALALKDDGVAYIDENAGENRFSNFGFDASWGFFSGEITIDYTITIPEGNQVPIKGVSVYFKENLEGDYQTNIHTFTEWLLPGETISGTIVLSYNSWTGGVLIWDIDIDWVTSDDYFGDYTFSGDIDGDTLSNYDECFVYGTNPESSDSDSDTMPDQWELQYGLNPIYNDGLLDKDSDGLKNKYEYSRGTNPTVSDTDGDSMKDGWEVTYGLNPLSSSDKYTDKDGDGLTNYYEYTHGLNPAKKDTDGDGLNDYVEIYVYGTDPKKWDTDGDGYSDGEEIAAGTNPLSYSSHPLPPDDPIFVPW